MKLSYDATNYVLWVVLWNFHESNSDHFELGALFIITTHLRPFLIDIYVHAVVQIFPFRRETQQKSITMYDIKPFRL